MSKMILFFRKDLEIFSQLDKLDGDKNGKISKTHLKRWISSSAQNLDTFLFQEKSALPRYVNEVYRDKEGLRCPYQLCLKVCKT